MSDPTKRATLHGRARLADFVHFTRGYFCAVAVLIREEGNANTQALSLFKQGGDWRLADDQDIELFREHRLIAPGDGPDETCSRLRKRAGCDQGDGR